jgi:hypothetical protein
MFTDIPGKHNASSFRVIQMAKGGICCLLLLPLDPEGGGSTLFVVVSFYCTAQLNIPELVVSMSQNSFNKRFLLFSALRSYV